MDMKACRKFGAAFVLVQGLLTALFPQLSVKFLKRMLGKNFDNVSELDAKPSYLRQLRAIGVGMVAAGGTDLLLQSVAEGETGDTSEPTADDDTDGDEEDTDAGNEAGADDD